MPWGNWHDSNGNNNNHRVIMFVVFVVSFKLNFRVPESVLEFYSLVLMLTLP